MDTKLLLPYWETIKDAIANAKMWLKMNWKPLVLIPVIMLVVSVFVLYYRNEAVTLYSILGMTGALIIPDTLISMYICCMVPKFMDTKAELFTLIPLLFGFLCCGLSYVV